MSNIDLTGSRILLVEDEYLIAGVLRDLLESWGGTVVGPAATAEGALALVERSEPIDFALVDVNLRGVPGFPVADALSARGIPYAFTTGYGKSMMPERHRTAAILQKPFTEREIATTLRALKLGDSDAFGTGSEGNSRAGEAP